MKKYFNLIFLFLILLVNLITSTPSVKIVKERFQPDNEEVHESEEDQPVVVIDPGHGGRDPGKVGVSNTLEKDINLRIALKLRKLLEENKITVIMTREEDIGLYSENDTNRKQTDLNARVEMIKSSEADLAVSIHQNSFTQEGVKGAQVFYHRESSKGKVLAELMQAQLITTLADGNHRKAKANEDYYMLRKTVCPFVIVECGFLSNYNEEALLIQDSYQEKLASAICQTILEFIRQGGLVPEIS